MEILEGFARMAYNFKIRSADEKCLFNLLEDEKERKERWSKELGWT